MKFFQTLALATSVLAAPTQRAAAPSDTDILQYALTLEHLENIFYQGALSKFSQQDFVNAGFPAAYYDNLKFISHDEKEHVALLTNALTGAGAKPVARCSYSFPYTDPKSFVTLSSVLEGVGTSAYLGAAGFISSKEYLGVAGSILVTEALHTSLQRYSIGEFAIPNPYGTGLGLNEVYTLAASFITSCPSSNAKLPVMAFPALTLQSASPTTAGKTVTFKAAACKDAAYLTFVSGLKTVSQPATFNGDIVSAVVPSAAQGQTYVLLTKSNVTMITDDQVVSGPAILEVTPPVPS